MCLLEGIESFCSSAERHEAFHAIYPLWLHALVTKRKCGLGCMDCAVSCMQDVPAEYTRNCTVASAYEVRRSMVPRTLPKLRLSKYGLPNDDPPQVPGSICNIAMPNQSTRARFLWVRPPFAQAYTAVHKMSILPKYNTLWTAIPAYS